MNETRGKKLELASFQETHPTHELAIHESLEVMDDAEEVIVTTEPESGQRRVREFYLYLASGEMDRCLVRFAPAAQAQLIEEVEAVQSLLEEFISKHQPIEVIPIHWFMNPEQRSNYVQPHIRFWCHGQISVSARLRIDSSLKSHPRDAQAMISEWVIK